MVGTKVRELQMPSGRQVAEQNVQMFIAWAAEKTDADFRQMVSRGVLSRTEIAMECGFAKSALDQNPRIKAALRELEQRLRDDGVLPPAVEKGASEHSGPVMREPGHARAAVDAERLRRLEHENAALRAEVGELKRVLEQFGVLRDALSMTGRLPR